MDQVGAVSVALVKETLSQVLIIEQRCDHPLVIGRCSLVLGLIYEIDVAERFLA